MNSPNPEAKPEKTEFEELGQEQQATIIQEFFHFILENKAWWMVPIVVVLGLMAMLILFSSTGAAPFIYTLF